MVEDEGVCDLENDVHGGCSRGESARRPRVAVVRYASNAIRDVREGK